MWQRTVEQIPDTLPDSTQNSPQERVQHHRCANCGPASNSSFGANCGADRRCTWKVQEIPEVQGEVPSRVVPQKRAAAHHRTICGCPSAAGLFFRSIFRSELWGQIVDVPAPCVEQNADVLAPAPARGTQAPQLSRWTLRSEGFSHFSPDEKSAKTRRQSSANLLSHSMPSTRAACEIEHLQYGELWWGRQWDPDSWWLVDPKDGARVSPIIWRPPWELSSSSSCTC